MKRKILNYHGVEYYRIIELLNEHPSCKYIDDRQGLKDIVFSYFGERYVTEDGWKEFEIQIKLDEDYYNSTNVEEIFFYRGRNPEKYLYPVLDKIVNPYIHNGKTYYKKKDIDSIANISEIYSRVFGKEIVPVTELVRYHNSNRLYSTGNIVISSNNIKYLYSEKDLFKTPYQYCVFGTYEEACREFERRCTVLTEQDWFDNFLGGPQKAKKNTYDLLKKYYISTLNKSKSVYRENVAKQYIYLSYVIYECIDCEIYDIDSEKIITFINNGTFREKYDIGFLNYIKALYPQFCYDTLSFRVKANNEYAVNGGEILSAEDFAALYDAVRDIERHLKSACEDYIYAKYWLYVMVLMVNFERGKDVVGMPIIDFPFEYDWSYLMVNGLTNEEILLINKIFGLEARGVLSSKQLRKKNHYTTVQILPAMAYAIYICNKHAKIQNALNLFDSKKGFNAERIYNKLGPEFANISSRTLNYTLAYYYEESGDASNEYRKDVYRYLSIMRGHKLDNPLSISQATASYIKSKAENDNVEEIARGVIEKGAFGWMYITLLNSAGVLPEETSAEVGVIKANQSIYGPNEIELLSKFYLNIEEERRICLSMLNTYDKGKIRKFLGNIGTVGTFRDESVFPCLFANECPYEQKQCRYCECSIKTLLSMQVYEEEIKKIIKQLRGTENDFVKVRAKFLIQKILTVFTDYIREYGKDTFKAIIDLDEISCMIEEIGE